MEDKPMPSRSMSVARQSSSLPVTDALEGFVRASAWAQKLKPKTLDALVSATTVRKLKPAEVLCRQGDSPEYWYGIMSGLLRLDVFGQSGSQTSLSAGPMGTWFGEGALLLGNVRNYEVSAMRESRVACMSRTAFLRCLREDQEFNAFMLHSLSELLQLFMDKYVLQTGVDPECRIARILMTLVGHDPHGLLLHIDIKQEELADLAGVSRQRANQALRDLQNRGLVELAYASVKILNLEGLGNL